MNRFRSFLFGLLLVPVLTLTAGPVHADRDRAAAEPARAAASYCWVFAGGRWILIPC